MKSARKFKWVPVQEPTDAKPETPTELKSPQGGFYFSLFHPKLKIIDDTKKIPQKINSPLKMPTEESIVDQVNREIRQVYKENGWPLTFCKGDIVSEVNDILQRSLRHV
jgi:hypothetical protein